ncbi:MAG: hypothetical protein CME19_04265 [Gemmatimonadetes bacterium]|nr:hypothetical protein [Gemmatimonadota bacterium]
MKITSIDILQCEGGWRTQNCVKIQTDEGITGYAECNCQRTARMIRSAIEHVGNLVMGRDPFQTEKIQIDLYRARRGVHVQAGRHRQARQGARALQHDVAGIGIPRSTRLEVRSRVDLHADLRRQKRLSNTGVSVVYRKPRRRDHHAGHRVERHLLGQEGG